MILGNLAPCQIFLTASDKCFRKSEYRWFLSSNTQDHEYHKIYHMVSEIYLQDFLNEFTYKLNQRCFGEKLFNRFIIAPVYLYVQHCG
jgi:hypothetical protein